MPWLDRDLTELLDKYKRKEVDIHELIGYLKSSRHPGVLQILKKHRIPESDIGYIMKSLRM